MNDNSISIETALIMEQIITTKPLKTNNMTVKQTAQELIGNFYAIQDTIVWTNDNNLINELNEWNETNKKESVKYWLILATKSALILAQNTLQALIDTHHKINVRTLEDLLEYDKQIKYWEAVRNELKKEVKRVEK